MLSRSNDPHTVDTHEGAKLVVISSACLESGNLGTMFLQQFDRPDAMPQLTNEQLFLESLTNKLAAMGTGSGSQQDCISQLRALNLGDDFWMYCFKVVPCAKTYSHKWTLCPCAHAGETARRRDPRTCIYKAVLCPLVKAKKTCPLGDACSYAHNVFEHWLHPSRYKTRLCSFGRNCNRPICFFAHSADELRCVPNVDEGKELDEREYLLQLMLAQEASQLQALGSAPAHSTPLSLSGTHATIDMHAHAAHAASNLQQVQHMLAVSGARDAARSRASAPNLCIPHPMTSDPMPHHPSSANSVSSSMSLLMNLQEALAGVTLGVEGLSALSGHHHHHHGASRTSDPGFAPLAGLGLRPHRVSAVHPQPHMNRISDSGQTLGVVNPQNLAALESLLPLVNSALTPQQQQAAAALVRSMSAGSQSASQYPASASSPPKSPPTASSPASSAPTSEANLGSLGSGTSLPASPANAPGLSHAHASPPSSSPSPGSHGSHHVSMQAQAHAQQAALLQSLAAAAGPAQVPPAYVAKIVSDLQEQGLAGSKEQLVSSLSQLLAQLLAPTAN